MKKSFLFIVLFISCLTLQGQQIGSGSETEVNNFNTILPSGMYYTDKAQSNYPYEIPAWPLKHLIVSRHPDGGCQLQLSSPFTHDDRMFFRKVIRDANNPNCNNPWYEFATREANTFVGTQQIKDGTFIMGNNEYGKYFKITHYPQAATYINFANFLYFVNESKSSQPIMQITHDGVDIGGYDHTDKTLRVAGNVITKEIRVQTNVWADFVFDPSYNLPSLKEVETHIQDHKHLPGIPTEVEVKENGVNLGDIQVKMLQKIEELTLYVIDLKKENEKQEEKIKEMQILINNK